MNSKRYFNEERVCVLIVEIDEGRDFYKPAAEAFAAAARKPIFKAACEAYIACNDRRKHYRFPAWRAEFMVKENNGTTELVIRVNDTVLRHERHVFDGELLLKRERLSNNL